jgi:hypothetical protein
VRHERLDEPRAGRGVAVAGRPGQGGLLAGGQRRRDGAVQRREVLGVAGRPARLGPSEGERQLAVGAPAVAHLVAELVGVVGLRHAR